MASLQRIGAQTGDAPASMGNWQLALRSSSQSKMTAKFPEFRLRHAES
jgi:hypothetical protein